ncbi:DHHC zinc finger domain containing protein [Trichomonas vaginalis G3]|uniref:Palmitoyltransferase n=1 Tax=Trichomonas vaginalis (strain ATCC PRA-98 / G3) TaxID=412133 RepID=A2FCT7_TRIV3|nr:DHHC palmitoyltransferase family [Trichomonas vaginalis G3]EAX97268.1 DHHC zinc finger domain containing protein [Trichomonas vaginalis G3]KAI5550769.1 DHHC palmitoyltransferase family [Trichomonas vaginalis G3]|eukprot:XP_001310198.1 DHHC zinc finger domain containing protein [Trichomonas vaginalis G3]
MSGIAKPLIPEPIVYVQEGQELYVTEWEDRSCCGGKTNCCRCAYFPAAKIRIWGHWIVKLPKVIFACSLFLASLGFFSYSLFFNKSDWFTKHYNVAFGLQIFGGFAFFCLSFAYFTAMIKGPGYYPYNWSLTRKTQYTWNEMMTGVAMFQEQEDFAKSQPMPTRSSFSVNARRFVIRADHICAYMQTWIGFHNHKYFIMTTMWATIYSITYVLSQISTIYEAIYHIAKKKYDAVEITMAALILVTVVFASYISVFSFRHFIISLRNLSRNRTITENYNNKPSLYDRGSACANCEEVCGKRYYFITWIFPFFVCYNPTLPKWDADNNSGVIDSESVANIL